jgi:hypothetical protein
MSIRHGKSELGTDRRAVSPGNRRTVGASETVSSLGATAQEEARISAEELKVGARGDKERRPVFLDLCLP